MGEGGGIEAYDRVDVGAAADLAGLKRHGADYYQLALRRREVERRLAQLEGRQRDRELERGRVGLFYRRKMEARLAQLEVERAEWSAASADLLARADAAAAARDARARAPGALQERLTRAKLGYHHAVRLLAADWDGIRSRRNLEQIRRYEHAAAVARDRAQMAELTRRRDAAQLEALRLKREEFARARAEERAAQGQAAVAPPPPRLDTAPREGRGAARSAEPSPAESWLNERRSVRRAQRTPDASRGKQERGEEEEEEEEDEEEKEEERPPSPAAPAPARAALDVLAGSPRAIERHEKRERLQRLESLAPGRSRPTSPRQQSGAAGSAVSEAARRIAGRDFFDDDQAEDEGGSGALFASLGGGGGGGGDEFDSDF